MRTAPAVRSLHAPGAARDDRAAALLERVEPRLERHAAALEVGEDGAHLLAAAQHAAAAELEQVDDVLVHKPEGSLDAVALEARPQLPNGVNWARLHHRRRLTVVPPAERLRRGRARRPRPARARRRPPGARAAPPPRRTPPRRSGPRPPPPRGSATRRSTATTPTRATCPRTATSRRSATRPRTATSRRSATTP